jgi:hypothetical protein
MITLGGWLNRTTGAIKREIVRQLGVITAVPYCAVYSQAGVFFPPLDFKLGAYPGLIAWHLVEQSSGHKIVSYWQDKEHFDYSQARFEAALKLAAGPDWIGAAGDLHAKEPTWWPSSIKEAVIAIAALVGALGVIFAAAQKVYELTWVTPEVAVSFASPKFNVTDGDPSRVQVTLTNTGFAAVEVNANAKLLGSPQTVTLDPPNVPTLDTNSSKLLTANLKEQHLQSPQSAAVDYTLSVTVSARTWKLRKPKVFPAFTVPVTIWPRRFGWTIPKRVPESNPRVYHAEGYLYPVPTSPPEFRPSFILKPLKTPIWWSKCPIFARHSPTDHRLRTMAGARLGGTLPLPP